MDNLRFNIKKVYNGITDAIISPNNKEYAISEVNWLWASSCPPLKPIEKSRYKEMNLADDSGMVRSLLILMATIPNIKKSSVGLVRLLNKISVFISYCNNPALHCRPYIVL